MGCAEFSRGGGGITDHRLGRKLIIAGEGVTHRTVILDGQALATRPLRILVSTAIGQLRIAIATIYSTGHNPLATVWLATPSAGSFRTCPTAKTATLTPCWLPRPPAL